MQKADAVEILDTAAETRGLMRADALGRYLRLSYAARKELGIYTIGAHDVTKRTRTLMRKRNKRSREAARRRATGATPHSESLSATKPWKALGVSRRTWYRHRSGTVGTDSCPLVLRMEGTELCQQRSARGESVRGLPRGLRPKEERGHPSSQTATIVAVYQSMPAEWRLMTLGLPLA